MSLFSLAPAQVVDLDAVITTAELRRRPARHPDYEAENLALTALVQELASRSGNVLQKLVETAMSLCEARSAGISILEEEDGQKVFRWHAIAGQWSGYVGGTMPREISPCGTVLDRNSALLMSRPERYYRIPPEISPPIVELLLIPFHVAGEPVGTLWVIAHDESRRFDAEDERLLTSLGRVASTAYQVLVSRTASAQTEGGLRRSEAKLRDFVENASVGLHWVDADGIILWANRTELELLGYAREEYVGRHIAELHVERPVIEDILARLSRGETLEEYEARLRCKDGSIRHVVINSNVLFEQGKFVHTRCITRDVTEQRRAEEELRESERRFREMIDALPAAIYTTDAEGRLTHFNPAAVEFSGRVPELGTDQWCVSWKLYHPDGTPMPHDKCPMAIAVKEGRLVRGAEALAERPDGKRIWFTPYPTPLYDAKGKIVGGINMLVDVSERKQAEEALRQSEARKTGMFETALDSIISIDHDGKVIEFNPAAERTFGHRREDVLGRELAELIIPPSLRQRHRQGLAHYLASGESSILDRRIEMPALRADGAVFPVELTVTRIHDGGPPIFTAYLRDITDRKQAEERLRESEEVSRRRLAELQTIYASAPIGLTFVDRELRYVSVNQALAEMDGLPTEQIIGRTLREVLPPEVADRVEPLYRRVVETGQAVNGVGVQGSTRAGRPRDFLVSYHPVKAADGAVLGVNAAVQDITERKHAEEAMRLSEERYRSLVSVITDVPWTSDAAGAFVTPQPAWAGYTGQSWDEHRGFGWTNAVHPEDREEIKRVWGHACQNRTVYESRGRLWHAASQQYRYFVARGTHLLSADGEVREWVGSCTDVHEQRMAEEALREADRRKDEFLATLAHELRNPLAPIRNSLHILRLSGENTPSVAPIHEMMERQVSHMVRLVDDLLELSRVSRGVIELKKERLELATIVRNAVEISKPFIEAAGHQLSICLPPEPAVLEGDPLRLSQVFGNLLNNAAKYTQPGGRIAVSGRREGAHVVVSVRDTGIGIPREMLSRVFDMFSRVDNVLQRTQDGLGIGLSLVRTLVSMHGGSVEAHSAGLGLGSEFVVRLPAVEGSLATVKGHADDGDHRASLPTHRILAVDDNRDAADSLAMLLRFLGADVHVAYDGQSALEAARMFRPSVVFLDLGMPGMDGYEVARHMREDPACSDALLIALSGWGQEENRRRSREAGFDHHLVKPVDLGALQALLASLQGGTQRGMSVPC